MNHQNPDTTNIRLQDGDTLSGLGSPTPEFGSLIWLDAEQLAHQIAHSLRIENDHPTQKIEKIDQTQLTNELDGLFSIESIKNIQEVQSFLEEIKCPICLNILNEPLYCKKCEKTLCFKCYQDWVTISEQDKCPCCREKGFVTSNVPKLFFNLLSKLKFSCPNKEKGCEQIIDYELMKKHLDKECLFALFKCDNQGCSENIKREDINNHQLNCPFKVITCQLCLIFFLRKNMVDHSRFECQKEQRPKKQQQEQTIRDKQERFRQQIRRERLNEKWLEKRSGYYPQ